MEILTTYARRRDLQLFRWASYVGGDDYLFPRPSTLSTQTLRYPVTDEKGNIQLKSQTRNSYLTPFRAEDDRSYGLRLQRANYINVVAPIVDAYARATTSEVRREFGALDVLADDVDSRGSSWGEFIESLARWLCVYGEGAIVVDAPKDNAASTRQDETARPYAVLVHPSAWAWTVTDHCGRVEEFAYVEQSILAEESTRQEFCVRVLNREGWQVRKGTVGAGKEFSRAFGELLEEGQWPPQLQGELPVEFAFFARDEQSIAPRGISPVADVCTIGRAIFDRRSWADTIAMEAGFPTLAIPSAGTGGQLDPSAKVEIGTSKALGYSANAGAPQWIQPSAEWFEKLHARNAEDFRLCLRLAGVDSDSDAGAAASGEALRIRSRDFESQCRSFARRLRDAEMRLAHLLGLFAGLDSSGFKATYPTRFMLPDRGGDFDRALALLKDSPVELGPSAKLRAAEQMVRSALVLSDEDTAKVHAELEALLAQDAARYQQEISPPSVDHGDVAQPVQATLPGPSDAQAKDPTTALNGAQVSSLLEIVAQAASRQIPRETAVQLIVASFPIDQKQADKILGKVGASFFAEPPAP